MSHDLDVHFFGETFPFAKWEAITLQVARAWSDQPRSTGITFDPEPRDADDERMLRDIWSATGDPEPRRAYARFLGARGDERAAGMLAQLDGDRAPNHSYLYRGFPGTVRSWVSWSQNSAHVHVWPRWDGADHPPGTRFDVQVSTSMGRDVPALFYQHLWPYVALRVFDGVAVHDCQSCDAGFFRDPAAYARHARRSLERGFRVWGILRRLRMVDDGDDPFARYADLVPAS